MRNGSVIPTTTNIRFRGENDTVASATAVASVSVTAVATTEVHRVWKIGTHTPSAAKVSAIEAQPAVTSSRANSKSG